MAVNMYSGFWSLVVCMTVTVLVSLFTKPKPEAELKDLVFGLTKIPAEEAVPVVPQPEALGGGRARRAGRHQHHLLVRKELLMDSKREIPIWFFIGSLLTVYGVLILGTGIYHLFSPPPKHVGPGQSPRGHLVEPAAAAGRADLHDQVLALRAGGPEPRQEATPGGPRRFLPLKRSLDDSVNG